MEGVIATHGRALVAATALIAAFAVSSYGGSEKAAKHPARVETTSAAALQQRHFFLDRTPIARSRLLKPFYGTVQAIFFHPLIVYPQVAFHSSEAQGYQEWFVTVTEFERMLPQLYANDYILISPYDLYDETTVDGQTFLSPRTLYVPPGKKPLLLSIDDLNYYDYMRQDGNCYRLVIDQRGNIAEDCPTPSGQDVISEQDGIVSLVDRFVAQHPDFSFDGAKGMINETGYQGVLGYRTEPGSPDQAQQIAEVRPIIAKLKATGWVFASHSWGHLDDTTISDGTFVADTDRWLTQVAPLVGPTPFYVYPFGATVADGSVKMRYLIDHGFHMFFGVGPTPYWQWHATYATVDRVHVDGMALMTQHSILAPFFNASTVIDYPERGLTPPNSGT